MNDTDVKATNTDRKPKLHKNEKNNVVPGSTKMLMLHLVKSGSAVWTRTPRS